MSAPERVSLRAADMAARWEAIDHARAIGDDDTAERLLAATRRTVADRPSRPRLDRLNLTLVTSEGPVPGRTTRPPGTGETVNAPVLAREA
ncbi:MAG: hypothetical protein ACRDQ0_10080 [Pseudonocardia sp.]